MGRVPNRGQVQNSWKKFGDLYNGFLWFSSSNRSQIGRAENASAISAIWSFLNMAFPLSTNYLKACGKVVARYAICSLEIVGPAAIWGKVHQGCSLDQTGDPGVSPAQDCALRKGRCPCLSLERKNPAKKAGLRNSTRGGKPRARKTAATPRVQHRGPIRRLSERMPASGSVAGGSFGNQACTRDVRDGSTYSDYRQPSACVA